MADELRAGTMLHHNIYQIIKVLGQGGFGITYLAENMLLNRYVAIKEYFPQQWCGREEGSSHVSAASSGARAGFPLYKEKFLKEARNIAGFRHPGIISIYAAFEENNTAYYVMELIEGTSLSDLVKHRGPLDVATAVRYIRGVGEALEYIHARHVNHLDVKPDNIMVRRDGDVPVLIDFGLSKRYDSTGLATSITPVGYSPGYASPEQQQQGDGVSEFSPRPDLYSLGATLYFLLTGQRPPDAFQLLYQVLSFPAHVPEHIVSAIIRAMTPNSNNRQPSVAAFLSELSDSPRPEPQPTPHPEPKPKPSDRTVIDKLGFHSVETPERRKGLDYDTAKNEIVYGVHRYKMVHVEGGTFSMGATPEQSYKGLFGKLFDRDEKPDDDEKPVHRVTLSSYYIGQTQISQWLWVAVMGNNPSRWQGDNLPVECVSWNDCQEFFSRLNKLTGKKFKLPTEAQWEYAARGGNRSNRYKYSGSNNLGTVAWYEGNSDGRTHEVGQKQPNELGLYDMTGNVWEWCSDWFGDYPGYSVTDPTGLSSGSLRVFRGGSWFDTPWSCRVACRGNCAPDTRCNNFGFRLGG